MNEMLPPRTAAVAREGSSRAVRPRAALLWLALPLFALVLAVIALVANDWLAAFDSGAPPVEKLTFERTVLDDRGIHLGIRAGGSEPMIIAQVQVDEAYWRFTQDPPGPLDRLATAWLHIPYPWVLGEKHAIKLLTRTGVVFEKEIEVAVTTPRAQIGQLGPQALLGAFVGIVPVVIGMMFYPALRGIGRRGLGFVLSVTVGLLAFLLVDTLEDALEMADRSAAAFQGPVMVLLVAAAAFLVLLLVGRQRGAPTGFALATCIALGIGLHNFGEGLAIGAAFAAGAASLGTFLVLGFTLHNITEGIGIVAPVVEERLSLPAFAALALLAGVPAIFGIWLGSLSYAPHWSAVALAVGAGAILQVIVEVSAYLARRTGGSGSAWLAPGTVAGVICGIGVMYATALLVKV